jgi:cytochrome P450
MSIFIALMLNPEIQIRAQEEIDVATGRERLPTFEDRSRLPFVDAICKEVLRWRPVLSLGEFRTNRSIAYLKASRATAVPHAATEDNIYEGFFIPKGRSS